MNIRKMTIHEPWWGAWTRFNWEPRTWGLGLDQSIVNDAASKEEELHITVEKLKSSYSIPARTAQEFAQEHKCEFVAKSTPLYVIPSTMLKPLVATQT